MNSKGILLDISNISKTYRRGEPLSALNQISLQIFKGETLGLIGESGCGKTALGRCLLRLINPTQGKILYRGEIIYDDSRRKNAIPSTLRKNMQIVFQNPQLSLDPRMTVKEILREPLRIHKICPTREREDEAICNLLQTVELNTTYLHKYPFELSGGMARKVLLSTALVSDCKVIIADEPTPGLDEKSLNEALKDFRDIADSGCAILMITHDIEAALKIADKIAVFYAGTTLEIANVSDFKGDGKNLRHPYSKALFNALPQNGFKPIKGSQPMPHELPKGCLFQDRCEYVSEECRVVTPNVKVIRDGMVRCLNAT